MPAPAIAIAFWIGVQSFLFSVAVPLIVHLMKAFGIGIIVYTGATFAIDSAEAYLFANYNSLPLSLYAMLTLAGVDAGIKIVLSAMAANIAIKAATGANKKVGFIA